MHTVTTFRWIRGIMVCLLCAGAVLLAIPALATPANAGSHSLAIGALYFQIEPACLGEVQSIPVSVSGPNGIQVSGAAITVNGTPYGASGPNGNYVIQYIVKKEGVDTLTIGATSKNFSPAAPIHVDVKGQQCGWNIRMDYQEVVKGGDEFEIDSTLQFPNQTFIVNNDGSLSLLSSQSIEAKYSSDIDNSEQAVTFHLTPKIDGVATINFSGKYDQKNGVLFITLSSSSIDLPGTVGVKVEDIQNLAQNLPTVTWATLPFSDVVNLANIKNWKASPTFDFKTFSLTKSAFYPEDLPIIYSSGTVIIERAQE